MIIVFIFIFLLVTNIWASYYIVYTGPNFSIANIYNSSTSYDILVLYSNNKGKLIYTDMVDFIVSCKEVEKLNELIVIGYTNINRKYENLVLRLDSSARILDSILIGDYYNQIPKLYYVINYVNIVIGLRGYRNYDSIYSLFFDNNLKVINYLVFEFFEEVNILHSSFLGEPFVIGTSVYIESKSGKKYRVDIFADGKYELSDRSIKVKKINPNISKYLYNEKDWLN